MKHTVYVFINQDGWYYGNLLSSREPRGTHRKTFYKDFEQALLFSSSDAAVEYMDGIINTNIADKMILVPLKIEVDPKQIFKAILIGVLPAKRTA